MHPFIDSGNPAKRPSLWKVLLLTALFGVLGYLGNQVQLPLGFNLSFIFGSIFTLLCTILLGWRWGLASTLLASSYTFFLWNHPYAIAIFSAETLCVGLALHRGHRNLLLIITLYWALLGIPLVFLFYGGIQHLSLQVTSATALKQAVNGLINGLLASTVIRYLPVDNWLGLGNRPRRYPLGAAIFDVSLLLLLIPSVAMLVMLSRREISQGEQKVATELRTEASFREGVLQGWVEQQFMTISRVAVAGNQLGVAPSSRLQERLQVIHEFSPDFINLFLCDEKGRSVAFHPFLNDQGKPNLGLEFSDHSYFLPLKTTLKPVISEVFIGRRAAFRPLFTMSVPLEQGGRFKGFASGAINLEDLKRSLIKSQGENPPLLILLDAQNKIVIATGPDHQSLTTLVDQPGTKYQKISEQVALHIPPSRRNVSPMDRWKAAHYVTSVPVRGTPWTLVIQRSAGPLQERAFQLMTWTLAGLGGLFLLVLLVASLAADALTKATVQLAAFSKDLPARIEKEEVLTWPTTRFEEIELMTSNFRDTSEALGGRLHQLKVAAARQMEAQRAMITQSRLAAMGEMIGNIAHQWRQPLSALSAVLGNLRDDLRAGDQTPETIAVAFARCQALIQKMSSTITDFRDFNSPDKEKVRFSALHQINLTQDLVAASFGASQVHIQLEAGKDIELFGFPNELSQVLINILSNARQAIHESKTQEGKILISLDQVGDKGRIRVWDNGGGIHEEVISRIFEPFFTSRESGSGIGLYMSKQIIEESMNGRLSARNVNGGAEFELLLPCFQESQ